MSIYYAHSMRTYGTQAEKEQLHQLRRFGLGTIVNPNGRLSRDNWKAQAKALIDSCDILVFSEYQQWIGKGVTWEIEYAHSTNKAVYVLRNGCLQHVVEYDIGVAGWDWAIRWAYLSTSPARFEIKPSPWWRRLFGSRLSLV